MTPLEQHAAVIRQVITARLNWLRNDPADAAPVEVPQGCPPPMLFPDMDSWLVSIQVRVDRVVQSPSRPVWFTFNGSMIGVIEDSMMRYLLQCGALQLGGRKAKEILVIGFDAQLQPLAPPDPKGSKP